MTFVTNTCFSSIKCMDSRHLVAKVCEGSADPPAKPDPRGNESNTDYENLQFFFHSDHLGSTSYMTDLSGEVSQHIEYFPYGGIMTEERTSGTENPYLFNGKELDMETGLYYYGARYMEPNTSIWYGVDPLSEKYPNMSGYIYAAGNPIMYIDPDGREVFAIFNRATGKVAITDLDHYQNGLPIKTASGKDYVHGGIRDDKGNLTHNQVLVLDNVFSGGRVESDGKITRDLERDKYEVAIPNGSYDLTEYEGGRGWYKVDPIDESRYDDHHQGYTNADGEIRNGYRFHLGELSHGCITVCNSNIERQTEWDVVGKIFDNTSKIEVPKREGRQKYIPGTTRVKYGTIKVIGEDRVKEVKKEE